MSFFVFVPTGTNGREKRALQFEIFALFHDTSLPEIITRRYFAAANQTLTQAYETGFDVFSPLQSPRAFLSISLALLSRFFTVSDVNPVILLISLIFRLS